VRVKRAADTFSVAGTPFRRSIASWQPRFGVAAVDLIRRWRFRYDGLRLHGDYHCLRRLWAHAIGHLKSVNPNGEIVRTARAVGLGLGIEKKSKRLDVTLVKLPRDGRVAF